MSRADVPAAADVVVVGGGVMGTSATYFLATRTDLDAVLLEKEAIASGSTGDSSAILRHHYGDREIYARMARWSHDFYRAFEERTGEAIAYAPNPMVRFAREGTDAADYALAGYEVLSALDLPVTRYGPDELAEAFPMLDLGAADLGVSDDAAAYTDGADVAGGFARAARREGAAVHTGVEVTDVRVEGGAVAGVETDAGTVEADAVVLTAGPWTPELARRVGVEVPITRSREQVLVLDPPADYLERYPDPMPTSAPPGGAWYAREDFGDGVLVATHHTGEAVPDPDRYANAPDEETVLDLTEGLVDHAPGLAEAGVRGRYCGVYSDTPDHDFVIDEAGPTGCYLGCGFSGHGLKHGPAVGRMLADLVAEGETDLAGVDLGYFSLDRFADDPAGHGRPDDAV